MIRLFEFLAALLIVLTTAAVTRVDADLAGPVSGGHLPAFMTGADVSELSREEQLGAVYCDNGQPGDALLMFKKRGCNLMRLRLWVSPKNEAEFINDLPYTISLGRRIKNDGFLLLLDLHYSDSWADPGQQNTPASWKGLAYSDLVLKVHDYSEDVISAMRLGGAMPDIVEVGNEINNGILWPSGYVEEPGGWARLNALLKSGIQGVRDGAVPGPSPRIMLHIANGAFSDETSWFFGNLEDPANGGPVDFDIMGFSYYPDNTKTIYDLKLALTSAIHRYHKPIVVAETAYPSGGTAKPDQAVYAQYGLSPAGQKKFLDDLIAMVKGLPSPYGRGVLYWAPEWLPLPDLPSYAADPLFDSNFNTLPGLDALSPR